jgi:hypothetical protein
VKLEKLQQPQQTSFDAPVKWPRPYQSAFQPGRASWDQPAVHHRHLVEAATPHAEDEADEAV